MEQFILLGIHLIVIERLEHPIVLAPETHLTRISPQAKKEFNNLKSLPRRF
jgi:hypothetical protein